MEQQYEEETVVPETTTLTFNVEHASLMNALTLCAKVVPKSGSIPILQCVKFDLKGDTLFITAMDMSQSVLQMLKVENKSNMNGSYLFPAKEGIELVKRLPHGSLTFTTKDSTVYIRYGERGKANLKILSAEEYPAPPRMEATEVISVPIEVLRKGTMAEHLASSDEKSPLLTGIHIYNQDGKIGFEVTDRHRIYRYTSEVEIMNQDNFVNAVINAASFKKIVDSFKDAQQIDLLITSSYLILRDKSTVYFGLLINGAYPDFSRIFGGMGKGIDITMSRGELDDTLNRTLSLDATNNRVTMEVDEEGMFVLHTQSENSELSESFTDVKFTDEFPTMKFNGRYLRDAILLVDREIKNIILSVSGSRMPGFIKVDGDPSDCCQQ